MIPEPPRGIRLSHILSELGASARSAPAGARADLSIGDIVDGTHHAGFAVMIAILALCSVPLPGVSVPFGAAITFGAAQMVIGMHRPWLPRWVRARRLSVRTLRWIGVTLTRWTAWLERLTRPRFEGLTRGAGWSLCGLTLIWHAIGLSLPLPIPGSNLFFIIPILIYAIGLLESDGLLVMVGHAITAGHAAAAAAFWHVVAEGLGRAAAWMWPAGSV